MSSIKTLAIASFASLATLATVRQFEAVPAPIIQLQPTTPGVTQHGNGHIDGTFIAKEFKVSGPGGEQKVPVPYAYALIFGGPVVGA